VDPDDPDALFGDGLRAFLIDLKINPDNTDALAVFWKLHASDVGELKKQEFVEGWSALGADSIPKMASIAQDIVSKTRPGESKEKMDQYRELYFWVFNYLKENKKKRTIPKDLGLSIWSIFFNSTNFPLVAPLAKFLSDHDQDHFTRDLWEMCFDFLRDTKADFSNFDPEGAWPVLIDSFVASFKK
jgi:DCN1-like protein 1/2